MQPAPDPDPAAASPVAIVGGGYMGTGIAQVLALSGHPCAIADVSVDAARAAVARCLADAGRLEDAGVGRPGSAQAIADRVRAEELDVAVEGAAVVVEAVPEQPALKRAVLAAIEGVALPGAVIATNTSAIPISELAEPLRAPERFLGCHWFNPAVLVPCVEVIPHAGTAPAVVDLASRLLARAGKQPVTVGDGPGFVANRLQMALFREAAAVVSDGVATPEQVDAVVRSSFGYRLPFLGPFAVADMAGLDVYAGAYAALEAGLGPASAAPVALTDLVEQGRLGTKAGGGFLAMDAPAAGALERWRDDAYAALAGLLSDLGPPPAP